jgi:hypothetical protein
MEARLKSGLWVAAYLRRCAGENIAGYVVRKGDDTSGTVIVKVNLLDGRARILVAGYDNQGERIWIPGLKDDPAPEADIDAYVVRAVCRDPDVWVVEIENRSGDARLEGL